MSDDEAPHDSNSGVLPPFVSSLYELVQDPATKHIVSFLPPSSKSDKVRFRVHNPMLMTTQILPKYFRHTKLTSFMRQLNNYGFSKVKSFELDTPADETFEFVHELDKFRPNRPDLLHQIVRRRNLKRGRAAAGGADDDAPSSSTARRPPSGAKVRGATAAAAAASLAHGGAAAAAHDDASARRTSTIRAAAAAASAALKAEHGDGDSSGDEDPHQHRHDDDDNDDDDNDAAHHAAANDDDDDNDLLTANNTNDGMIGDDNSTLPSANSVFSGAVSTERKRQDDDSGRNVRPRLSPDRVNNSNGGASIARTSSSAAIAAIASDSKAMLRSRIEQLENTVLTMANTEAMLLEKVLIAIHNQQTITERLTTLERRSGAAAAAVASTDAIRQVISAEDLQKLLLRVRSTASTVPPLLTSLISNIGNQKTTIHPPNQQQQQQQQQLQQQQQQQLQQQQHQQPIEQQSPPPIGAAASTDLLQQSGQLPSGRPSIDSAFSEFDMMDETDALGRPRLNTSSNFALNTSGLNQAGRYHLSSSPLGTGSGRLRGVVGDLNMSQRMSTRGVLDSSGFSRTAGTPQQ